MQEFTFPLFLKVVAMMPSGKAVGEGGFSIELLRAAGDDVLRMFYDTMMRDLAVGKIPSNWGSVCRIRW